MDGDGVTEAMRYGAKQSYEEDALGKVRVGSEDCVPVSMSAAVRGEPNAPERSRIEVRKLDLDHVLESDRWEIFALDASRCDERLVEPLQHGPGTVVLWQSLDRVLGYKIPSGKRARSAVDSLAEQLDLHLGMTFHRFLSGEVEGRKRLRIKINGRSVQPWDPFARDEAATEALPGCDIDVVTSESVGLGALSAVRACHRASGSPARKPSIAIPARGNGTPSRASTSTGRTA